MNLKNILFQELINIEKEQVKLSKRRLELRSLLNLGKEKPKRKFTKRFNSKPYKPYN